MASLYMTEPRKQKEIDRSKKRERERERELLNDAREQSMITKSVFTTSIIIYQKHRKAATRI